MKKNANRINGIRPVSAQTFFNKKTANIANFKAIRPVSAAVFRTNQNQEAQTNEKTAKIKSYDFDFLKNCKDFSMNTTQTNEKPNNYYHEYLFYKPKLNKNKEVS